MDIIAWRGDSYTHEENTIEACRSAVGKGFDRIEIDVRLTADNVLVAYHSPTMSSWDYYKSMTEILWEELKTLSKNEYYVSRVKDILVDSPANYLLHLKRENCTSAILDALVDLPYPVDVHSNSETLLSAVKHLPTVFRVFKSIYKAPDHILEWVDGYMVGHRAGFGSSPISNRFLTELKEADKIIWTFAGNTEQWLKEVSETPTDGVLTARIDRARRIFYGQV